MNVYSYKGPVFEFDKCSVRCWEGRTSATSEGKARSNLAFQFKEKYGLYPNAKVTLPGKITLVS